MIKLIQKSIVLIKSFDIYEIFYFIIENPDLKFYILVDYDLISNNDFCKLFLSEVHVHEDYIKLESVLHQTPKINELFL